jgi:hypothetical protein
MSSRQRARVAASLRHEREEASAAAGQGQGGGSNREDISGGDNDNNDNNNNDNAASDSDSDSPAGKLTQQQPAFGVSAFGVSAFGVLSSDSDSSDDDGASLAAVAEARAQREQEAADQEERKSAAAAVSAAAAGKQKSSKKKKKGKGKQEISDNALKAAGVGGGEGGGDSMDDEILAALEELGETEAGAVASRLAPGMPLLTEILKVTPISLDVDSLMRQRFAGAAADTGEGGRRAQGGPRGTAKAHAHRLGGAGRFVFGMPKDDWAKPPSYVGGGVGMTASPAGKSCTDASRMSGRQVFQFMWADEYLKINEQFEMIQKSGNANRLVQFLSQYYYHQEGLLQLAMVFARTGQMDRAADLVRRCLYCLHCAEAEGFRPCSGRVMLDPSVYENRIYFAAVFRHMQIVGMLGCPSVAANIAKLLLSLDVFGDTAHVLLCLDYYLLAAGEAEDFENIFTNAGQIIIGVDSVDAAATAAAAAVDDSNDAKSSGKEKEEEKESGDTIPLTLADLPNWAYAAALCSFLRYKKCGVFAINESNNSSSSSSSSGVPDGGEEARLGEEADSRLRKALIKYPFFLYYILPPNVVGMGAGGGGGGGSVVGTASSAIMPRQWQDVLAHPYFNALPESILGEYSALGHLGNIYRARSASLWANKKGSAGAGDFVDVEKWVYDIATTLLCTSNTSNTSIIAQLPERALEWRGLCTRPEIKKYLSAEIDDFLEEFPRLPPDANPLDPQFADPRAMLPLPRAGARAVRGRHAVPVPVAVAGGGLGRQRPNHNRRVVNHGNGRQGQGQGHVPDDEEEEAHMMRQLAQFEAQEGELRQGDEDQRREMEMLRQYEHTHAGGGGGGGGQSNETLLKRITDLPKPLKTFLLNILEQRAKSDEQDSDGEADPEELNMYDFIDEGSLLAEMDIIRRSDTDGRQGQ